MLHHTTNKKMKAKVLKSKRWKPLKPKSYHTSCKGFKYLLCDEVVKNVYTSSKLLYKIYMSSYTKLKVISIKREYLAQSGPFYFLLPWKLLKNSRSVTVFFHNVTCKT